MAAPLGKSKEVARLLDAAAVNERTRQRLMELGRMRALATGLLVAMLAVFVATTMLMARWPGLAFVRAFAEAGMVGACADWFAVVALFRHPFGVPIPHTAIIPKNKERIGDSLGSFICNNFLAPEVVAHRIDSMEAATKVADWLCDRANAAFLAKRLAGVLPPMLAALEEDDVRYFVRGVMRRGVESVAVSPLAARVLSVLVAHGHHQALFDQGIAAAEDFLIRNEGVIRAKVSTRSWKWLPKWVDEKLADKVMNGLLETVHELRAPDHAWRGEFQSAVEEFIRRLATDEALRARGEAIKAEVLANPLLEDYLDSLWAEIKARLVRDINDDGGVLRRGLEEALLALGGRLREDARMQSILNRWVRRGVDRYIIPNRGEIGAFIAGVVARWDSRTLVSKLEVQVGKDLQYIRINGTLVGGVVGVIIYALDGLLR
ncbi:MAG: DUF445 domain-containing protein [Magnetospirillum sp.]|nr:DUF445 domain-containing protein [Magnetospirillum sp.]